MEKIKNFMLPEHFNNVYRSEASSAIHLTREVADKINEIVDRLNAIDQEDLAWKQTQEGTIRKAALFMKDNLINSLQELFDILHMNGFIDGRIAHHANTLSSRLNTLLGAVTSGSTSMDAEIIDGRVGDDGTVYSTIGEAIRGQIHQILHNVYLYYGIDYDTDTGVVTLNMDSNNGILYNIFKLKYTSATPATVETSTATYDGSTNRPNIVALNIVDGTASLKCSPINTYTPDPNDTILFMIYYNRVIPIGLLPQCITVNGEYLADNPSTKKLYNSGVVGLSGGLTINQETLQITLRNGFYIFPMDRVGAVTIPEQTVTYELSGLVRYLILNEENVLSIVERNHIFQKGQYCLGCIYMGKFIPVELSVDSITYTQGNKEVILPEKNFLSMNDFFRTLSDTTKTTKIVLGGDSITHGNGGTGYAQSGDNIITVGSTTYKRNPNGHCWANLFKSYIESNYNATVTNNGCTGTHSTWWNTNKGTLIPADTDIFILTIGTNDRNSSAQTGSTKAETLTNYYNNLTEIVEWCHERGIQIVLCSPIPATAANEGQNRLAHISDMNAVIQRVASEHNMDYANLYNEMFFYIMDNGLDLEELLPDGLHPGDTMYTAMFYRYLKLFNLGPAYNAL